MWNPVRLGCLLTNELTSIVIIVEATQGKKWLDRDSTPRHATLNHGCLVLWQGRVPCAEQEVVQVGVQMTRLGVDLGLVHLGRVVLPVSPNALERSIKAGL